MSRRTVVWSIVSVVLAAACGGSDGGGPTNPSPTVGNNTLSMTVDGAAWAPLTIAATHSGTILAVGSADASGRSFGFAAYTNVGNVPQDVSNGSGANASLTQANGSWAAVFGTGSGTITVSSANASRATGSFNLTMGAGQGGHSSHAPRGGNLRRPVLTLLVVRRAEPEEYLTVVVAPGTARTGLGVIAIPQRHRDRERRVQRRRERRR
jgi:hypothetical protein